MSLPVFIDIGSFFSSKIKGTMAKYFNGRALISNENVSLNVIRPRKMAPVAKLSKMLAVI